ncbi:L-Aspartase-like protein [Fusarium redolens]|uniref:Arginosuccinase n=1 Tax=Fusarium redolens TaxID=48865 RepID=A0A9P9HPZ5_FUSRE|nr:L-Aspartase-like protein [Fusarium redolens]KAH7261346.1 L-Aspartase-like protein [Fusarium redolens]
MASNPSTLLWGGRFTGRALHEADIRGSITFAKALRQLDLLTDEELGEITTGLEAVEKEWAEGKFIIHPAVDEDIHTANERRLAELIGPTIVGKLHTGRSRNEQIATDVRLWMRAQLDDLSEQLRAALAVCAARANAEIDVLMPGYTHFQRAQPDLGFSSVHPNSLAAVADCDFVAEILQWSSLPMVHLSRLSEDLIIYSTAEFSFVQVADAYSTGSSLMPQKKNPNNLELIWGKAGRVMGQASGFLSTPKSLPTAYNKDIQESVEPLLDCIKTIDSEKMKAALTVDYLVVKGVPFRQTHHIAGAVVRKAEEKGASIAELELPDLKQISPQFEADIVDVFDFERSVERRSAQGMSPALRRRDM